MPYNVSLNQYFEFFTTTDHTRRKLQLVQYIPPPTLRKGAVPVFLLFYIVVGSTMQNNHF